MLATCRYAELKAFFWIRTCLLKSGSDCPASFYDTATTKVSCCEKVLRSQGLLVVWPQDSRYHSKMAISHVLYVYGTVVNVNGYWLPFVRVPLRFSPVIWQILHVCSLTCKVNYQFIFCVWANIIKNFLYDLTSIEGEKLWFKGSGLRMLDEAPKEDD